MRRHQLHIPRTGGTALRNYLQGTSWQYHDHRTTLADIPGNQPVLVTLRDPIERFRSLYALAQNSGTPIAPIEEFTQDMELAAACLGDRWDYLFRPMTAWVWSAYVLQARNVKVFYQESLPAAAEEFFALGPFPAGGVSAHKPELSAEAHRALFDYYEDDYSMLQELAWAGVRA